MSIFTQLGQKSESLLERVASRALKGGVEVVDQLASKAGISTDLSLKQPLLQSIYQQLKEGSFGKNTLFLAQTAIEVSQPLDDRQMLLEKTIERLAALPPDDPHSVQITAALIRLLWEDLPKPPTTFLGSESKFRTADGSGNNRADPTLGQAGTPYARSVAPMRPQPPKLADPADIFDALLAREEFVPHPAGLSSLMFHFASIVIHNVFDTNAQDMNINDTSGYVDLAPLYGNNQEEQNRVRTFSNGMLYPDVYASDRLALMPPGVSALLVLFCRNHNFTAKKLLAINENGRFTAPSSLGSDEQAQAKWVDEQVFQTARLINIGFFAMVVLGDYVRAILNTAKTDSDWTIPIPEPIHTLIQGTTPRGTGTAVSIEFNILYRWHSTISQADEKWIKEKMQMLFKKDPDEITEADFLGWEKMKRPQAAKAETVEGKKIFPIERNADGRYPDEYLCDILTKATLEPAGAFGARHFPKVMKAIDVMGMRSARTLWHSCTLNEFRTFFQLKPFSSFNEWNEDPDVASAAEKIYGNIDDLELLPGLQAEQAKPEIVPGSGLATGYTISRAILADAVQLVRGDRFLTTDYHPGSLTGWGFEDAKPDTQGGSHGGMLGKLFMRNLPNSYTPSSIFALYPFHLPKVMADVMKKLGHYDEYDFQLPVNMPATHYIESPETANEILNMKEKFASVYVPEADAKSPKSSPLFFGFSEQAQQSGAAQAATSAFLHSGWKAELQGFCEQQTKALIKADSWTFTHGRTQQFDALKSVANMTPVYWVARQLAIPLQTSQSPGGIFTPQDLGTLLSQISAYVYYNFDTPSGFKLRQAAIEHVQLLTAIIEVRISQAHGRSVDLSRFPSAVQKVAEQVQKEKMPSSGTAHDFYKRLLSSREPVEKLAAITVATVVSAFANVGEVTAHVVNFFLSPTYRAEGEKLAQFSTAIGAEAAILNYAMEALRLDPLVSCVPRVALTASTVQDGEKTMIIKSNDLVALSIPQVKQEFVAQGVVLDLSSLGLASARDKVATELFCVQMTAILKEIFELPNLRHATGASIQLYPDPDGSCLVPTFIAGEGVVNPYSTPLALVYDGHGMPEKVTHGNGEKGHWA